jgi:hypothetical protein
LQDAVAAWISPIFLGSGRKAEVGFRVKMVKTEKKKPVG